MHGTPTAHRQEGVKKGIFFENCHIMLAGSAASMHQNVTPSFVHVQLFQQLFRTGQNVTKH